MTNAETITNETVSPAAALWRIALSDWAKAQQDYAKSARKYEAACREFDAGTLDKERFFRVDEEEHSDAATKLSEARDKFLATPAPNPAALGVKLDTLTDYLTECHSEDLHRVAALRDDARRLFGNV
jgi:hypothetical protein